MLRKSLNIMLLLVITFTALGLRMAPVILEPETRRGGMGPYADPRLYHELAVNLVSAKGYRVERRGELEPVIMRAPGYSLFLALIYPFNSASTAVTQTDWQKIWLQVRLVQCALDASLCLAAAFIVWLLLGKLSWPGLLAALFQCFNLFTIHYCRTLLTETLAAFFLLWALFFLVLSWKKGRLMALVVGGLLLGALALTRTEYLPFALALPGGILFFRKIVMGRRLLYFSAAIFTVLLMVLPWTFRNHLAFDRIVLISSGNLGENLYRGTFEGQYPWKGWNYLPQDIFESPEAYSQAKTKLRLYLQEQAFGSEAVLEYDDYFMAKAKERIKEKPREVFSAWIKNLPRLWFQNYTQIYADPEPSGRFVLAWLGLSVMIILLPKKGRFFLLPLALAPLYLSLVMLPLHIEPRYSVPMTPVLVTLAALGVAAVLWRLQFILKRIFPPALKVG